VDELALEGQPRIAAVTRLLLLRHGETDGNRSGQLLGMTDLPLNELGRAQARALGLWLRDHQPLDAIISSGLARARETAAIIAEGLGRPVPTLIDPDLAEMNFGAAEGVPIQELPTRFPELSPFVGTALADHPDWQWPGGDFRNAYYRRVIETIERLAARHRGQTIGLVTHGGVITGYLHWLEKRVLGFSLDHLVANCSVTELRYEDAEVSVVGVGDLPWATKGEDSLSFAR
jgi:probable phosphoglycerate mutase